MKLILVFGILLVIVTKLAYAPQNTLENKRRKSCKTNQDCLVQKREQNNKNQAKRVCIQESFATQKYCVQGLSPPPPALLLQAISLGRPRAAADILWIQTMQFIGSHFSEAVEYHGIEEWIDTMSTLKPNFKDATLFAGILLSTYPNRAKAADRFLQQSEKTSSKMLNEKPEWNIPFWRASIQYYSLRNNEKAAELYQKAADLGAPEWVSKRAKSILKQKNSCAEVAKGLTQVFAVANQGKIGPKLNLASQQKSLFKILSNCYSANIEQAEAAFLLSKNKRALSIKELLDSGFLEEKPKAPPGYQWKLIEREAELIPISK